MYSGTLPSEIQWPHSLTVLLLPSFHHHYAFACVTDDPPALLYSSPSPPVSSCFFSSSNPSVTISSPLTQHLIVSCFSLIQSLNTQTSSYIFIPARGNSLRFLHYAFHSIIKSYLKIQTKNILWNILCFYVDKMSTLWLFHVKIICAKNYFFSLLKYKWLKLNLWDVISQFPIVWIFKSHFINLNTWEYELPCPPW